jgi:hypothetical protein
MAVAKDVLENGSSRGEFLARGAGVAGLAVGAGVWAGGLTKAQAAEAASDSRSYVSGKFSLELNGIPIALLKKMEGGEIIGHVADVPIGDTRLSTKHISNVKYSDFTTQVGLPMQSGVFEWIAETWAAKASRRDGAVVMADFDFKAKRRIEFDDALITEVGFPSLDASSKDTGYMTIKFAPEMIRNKRTSGKLASTIGKRQKQWLTANFKLTLGDLPCKRVSKIDAFTIKQAVVTDDIGDARIQQKEPGKIEFPNLTVTFSEVDIRPWDDWFEKFVVQGNSADDQEKKGRLSFLAPNLKDELGAIDLFNVGIIRLSYDNAEVGSNKVKKVTAELYVEKMEFKIK